MHGEPDSPRPTAQMAAEAFKGFAVEEYRADARGFMSIPAQGFAGIYEHGVLPEETDEAA